VLALGISTKTMYNHFNNKEELLEECLKLHYKADGRMLDEMLAGSPNVVVSIWRIYSKSLEMDFGVNHLFYQDLNYYYPELQDKIIEQCSGGALEYITGLIEQGISEGYFLDYLKAPVVEAFAQVKDYK
jgi:AcrR family transcriptional regulator